ncbi:MAG: hypothetical protein ACXVCP_16480 [Bdellovibrio sp.]
MASTRYSLELGIDPQVEDKVRQLLKDRLPISNGFSEKEIETLVLDLSALGSIIGGESSPLYYDIFLYQKQFRGEWLLRWLINGIKNIKASKGNICSNLTEANYNACAVFSTQTVLLSPQYFLNDRLRRILTLIHERRHFDDYNHVPNTPSYDDNIQGSNGAQLAFLVSLINACDNCTNLTKVQANEYIKEITAKFVNLSSSDQMRLNQELSSIKINLPDEVLSFISVLKNDKSYLTMTHFECKNGIPLFEYDRQKLALPNVDAVDCFFVYYDQKQSPNLSNRFPTATLKSSKFLFSFVGIKK